MGKFFSVKELTNSNTAKQKNINNTPSKEVEANIELLITKVLDPIREAFNKPIYINSGYRCSALNKAVKGAPDSSHLYGEAADLDSRGNNLELWNVIMKLYKEGKIEFDQCINEKPIGVIPKWIHIAYKKKGNRNMVFTIK
ncbi:MAG: D-Ala-D-Ala carboxypeptidase family metallohydrolase [Clostridia bacterium]